MADQRGLLSGEHFGIDSTLIQTWARHESLRRKDGSDDARPRTGTASLAATTRTSPRAIPSRGCAASATPRLRCPAAWAMC